MLRYALERLDTENQFFTFDAENLQDAVRIIMEVSRMKEFSEYLSVGEWRTSSALIVLRIPYGESIVYEVGELGRSD